MKENTVVNAVRQLLEQTRLPGDQLTIRLEQARSPVYWAQLNPSLSIGRSRAGQVRETRAIGPRGLKRVVGQLTADGYFAIESLLPRATIGRMRRCIEVLRREDWPPVFSFVYDEFWEITRVPSLVRLLSAVLGPGYWQTPHVWSFYVAARPGAAGWLPHVDGYDSSKRNSRMVVWIPLSDATLDNGCIYVLPRRRLPHGVGEDFLRMESLRTRQVKALLQSCRALPARVGTVLGWDFNLVHWGSVCGDTTDPRISLSVEFLAASAEPEEDELPLLEAKSDLPEFARRLDLIAKAIRDYEKFEPRMIRYHELAARLAEPGGMMGD